MAKNQLTVDHLMKVSLTIEVDDAARAEQKTVPFEFIFGVGAGGVTPFEKALFGKCIGDSIRMEIGPAEWRSTVGHLELPLREQTGIGQPAGMAVTVTDIIAAQDREVVKAMASGGSCGDCDCGCGGH